jgi:hypothetical protein
VATVFKVSEAQWVKQGLPASGYKTLLQQGYQPRWKQGGGFTLTDSQGCDWGFAKVKGAKISPDHIFKAKYQEVVGHPLTLAVTLEDSGQSLGDILGEALAQTVPVKKAASLPSKKIDQVLKGANLSNVEEVGVYVKGTDSPYLVYLLSDDCNIAYRYKNSQLAIRTEAMTPAAKKAVVAWGLGLKTTSDGRSYASNHLSVTSLEVARRTLGSLAASVLTAPPKKMLSKDEVK